MSENASPTIQLASGNEIFDDPPKSFQTDIFTPTFLPLPRLGKTFAPLRREADLRLRLCVKSVFIRAIRVCILCG